MPGSDKTMPSAAIARDVHLHYEDSGKPPDVELYTTIVVVHGLAFNGASFEQMVALAPSHDVRVIALNMRDYRGSTPYTDAELAEFVDKSVDGQAKAVRRVAREIAAFLGYVCTELDVPPLVLEGGFVVGGVVLMTWSMYTMGLLAMLGDPEVLDDSMKATLQPFLSKVVLYDPPYSCFGEVIDDPYLTHPFKDPSVSLSEKPAAFLAWATAHYTPIPDSSPKTVTSASLRTRTTRGTPTTQKLTSEEAQRLIEPGVMLRSGALLMTNPAIHARNFERVLFDADVALPDVEVLALWCDSSMWTTVLAAKHLDETRARESSPGKRKRALYIVKIEDANHMYHLEQPKEMLRLLVSETRRRKVDQS